MTLRLIASPPRPAQPEFFPFNLAAIPAATITGATGSSRTPALLSESQNDAPITPVRRFPGETMGMFHARGMDEGETGMTLYTCPHCGRIVMEGRAHEHISTCLDVIKQLEEQRNSLMLKNAGKKGQKPGLKRRGSDTFTAVSPSPSNESPRKGPKRPKIEISESVASDGDYGGLPTDPTGRIMFPDGRLEPKKAFEKRMVEQRRLAKEQDKLNKELDKSKLLSSTGGQLQKKKVLGKKGFDPDIHCGVFDQEKQETCKRNLECRRHVKHLKDEVPGRSMSWEDLVKIQKGIPLTAPVTSLTPRAGTPLPTEASADLGATAAAGSSTPLPKPKKGRKKHMEARRIASGALDMSGAGLLEYDALVQAVKSHTRINSQTARQRMYGMIAAPPSEDVKPNNKVQQSVKTEGEEGDSKAHDVAVSQADGGNKGKAKPPGSTKGTMRFQTFAGGATSGYWHGERRRLVAAESTMSEIFKQLKRNQEELANKVEVA